MALKKPSVAVYVQTADCWDAEKKLCCQFTQAKEGNDPSNQNFMETLELQVDRGTLSPHNQAPHLHLTGSPRPPRSAPLAAKPRKSWAAPRSSHAPAQHLQYQRASPPVPRRGGGRSQPRQCLPSGARPTQGPPPRSRPDPPSARILRPQVQLPDDIEYAPSLEFVLQSEDTGMASAIRGLFGGDAAEARHTVAWGSLPLAEFHPQGPEQAEDAGGADEDAEEDVAAQRRVEERARRKNFREMIDYLLSRQIIAPENARTLRINFESEEKRDRVIEVARRRRRRRISRGGGGWGAAQQRRRGAARGGTIGHVRPLGPSWALAIRAHHPSTPSLLA